MTSHENVDLVASPEQLLVESVRRHDFFADDATDEFQIEREDGTSQGMFKVWAAPIIASLESMNPVQWANTLRDKPLSLFECLESWRANSAAADRTLQKQYLQEQLPEERNDRVAELFARMTAAFAANAPFYHVEALVADSRADRRDNPINFNEKAPSAGKLDAIAMLLPSAIKNLVVSSPGGWNDLTWEKIGTMVKELDNVPIQSKLLHRVASLASLDIETVVFAANVLEFIPHQVGGKTDDFDQEEAQRLIEDLLDAPDPVPTTVSVAKDMNAFIRFQNWTPAIKSNDNFAGKNWSYDSVCATASDLLSLVTKHAPEVFNDEFSRVFTDKLAPKLDGIDATSAKGRFLLQLLQEDHFEPTLTTQINHTIQKRVPEIFEALKAQSDYIDFKDFSFVSQVGGKAIGLRNAQRLFGSEAVIESSVVPVAPIVKWLMGLDGMPGLLLSLECESADKTRVAAQIASIIQTAAAPGDLLANFVSSITNDADSQIVLRSSSFDEDVDVIGPAPGIYESVVGIVSGDSEAIGVAFKEVVASFFSDKAVHFRELKGLRHKPIMAVLGQKMIEGPGGSLFAIDGEQTINIGPNPSIVNDLERQSEIQHIKITGIEDLASDLTDSMPIEQLKKLSSYAKKAHDTYGPIDMEFVLDSRTKDIKILQLRRLERPTSVHKDRHLGQLAVLPIVDFSNMHLIAENASVRVRIDDTVDIEKFQGELFKSFLSRRNEIASVIVSETIPATCHFMNILMTMGITVETM